MNGSTPALQDRVAALLPAWRGWLRAKHPRLEPLHGDVANEAAADLLAWCLGAGESVPEDDLRRVGFRILQRRASDCYRAVIKGWAMEELHPEHPDASAHTNPVAVLAHKRRLRRLIGFLASLSPEDQTLLVGEELGQQDAERKPMSPAERKRLARLRDRAREAIGKEDEAYFVSWTPEDHEGEES